jgi:hypothetical protein
MPGHPRDMRRLLFCSRKSRFRPPVEPMKIGIISGITRNSIGAALGGCTVDLFTTVDDVRENTTVSDGSGNYSFAVGMYAAHYCVAYLAGSPDVAGTTRSDLKGV